MKTLVAIGIDLGGTNLKGAAVDRTGTILTKQAHAVAGLGPDAVIAKIGTLVDRLLSDASLDRTDLVGVGVGAPGPLSHRSGRIIRAANLSGWEDVPLRDRLSEMFGKPILFDNDGNMAAYGEFWAGAGKDGDDLVVLTLGTGVGAGVVLDGRILHGHFENAAELGHMIVAVNGERCSCGQRGCLEQYASAGAVARRVVAAIEKGEAGALTQAVAGGEPVDAERVAQCAGDGDALCLRIWDEACLYLAVACVNIQHAFNPARIVLGGGMAEAGDFLLDRVTEHVTRQRWSLHDDFPAITLARLGYDAGVIGAAGIAWRSCGQVAR
jgi:glucokinase